VANLVDLRQCFARRLAKIDSNVINGWFSDRHRDALRPHHDIFVRLCQTLSPTLPDANPALLATNVATPTQHRVGSHLVANLGRLAMARRTAVHTLELVSQRRSRAQGRRPESRQTVDVTLRTSDRMLLTVEEAAERLGVGRSTMYQLIANGLLETVRVGRLRRIEPDALASYIAGLRQHPDPAA
jgi:excisionase family DNA binding protein